MFYGYECQHIMLCTIRILNNETVLMQKNISTPILQIFYFLYVYDDVLLNYCMSCKTEKCTSRVKTIYLVRSL